MKRIKNLWNRSDVDKTGSDLHQLRRLIMFEKTMVRVSIAALWAATVATLTASGHWRTSRKNMKRLLAVLAAVLLLNCTGLLAATDVIDKSPDLGAGWDPIGYLDTQVYADSFVAPISGPITELGTWLKEYNDGSCNVTFQVYGSIDGNAANGPDISDVYATTGTVSGLSPSALTYYQFSPLSGGTPLILGDTYWFGINAIGATSGRYQVGNHTRNSGGIVDNGTFWYSNSPPVFDGKNLTPEMAFSVSVTAAVPEPSTLALLAAGAIGLVGYVWRRRVVRTAKPTAFDQQDAPAILSFPSHSSQVSAARRAA